MKCCRNCAFLQNFHTRKLDEITAFCVVYATKRKFTKGEHSCYFAKEQKSFRNLDLAELIQERVISSCTELLAIAEEQRTVGQMKIAQFVIKGNEKIFREIVTKTWKMESVKEKLEVSKLFRIDCIKTHLILTVLKVVLVSSYNVPRKFFCSIELTSFRL